jgi:hypothetical protein
VLVHCRMLWVCYQGCLRLIAYNGIWLRIYPPFMRVYLLCWIAVLFRGKGNSVPPSPTLNERHHVGCLGVPTRRDFIKDNPNSATPALRMLPPTLAHPHQNFPAPLAALRGGELGAVCWSRRELLVRRRMDDEGKRYGSNDCLLVLSIVVRWKDVEHYDG